jgi:hypothetical protein
MQATSPLFNACSSSNLRLFRLLISLPDARLDIISDFGTNVVHVACEKNTDEYIRVILEHKPDDFRAIINSRARNGRLSSHEAGKTPLHIACERANVPSNTIRILLDNGADVNLRESEMGDTVIHLVIASIPPVGSQATRTFEDVRDIIELLLKHGADINAMDVHRRTAVFDCVCRNSMMYNAEVFRLLLYHGADINIPEGGVDMPGIGRNMTLRRMAIFLNGRGVWEVLDEYERCFNGRQALAMGIGGEPQNHSNIKVLDNEIAKMISKSLWISKNRT